MKQVQIHGPCSGPEGYSSVVRGFVTALDKRGWNVKLDPFQGWGPWRVKLAPKVQSTLQRCINNTLYPQQGPIPHLQICLPEQVKPVENRINVNFTMFEADKIAKNWVEAARVIDKVLVPNTFCSDVFQRSGIPAQKLGIVSLGFNPDVFNDSVEPLPFEVGGTPVSSYRYRIMSVLEVTNRKNFAGLLLLYFRAAARLGVDECCLILKASNYSVHLPLSEKIKAFRDKFVDEGKIPALKYNVFSYAPIVPDAEMGSFMRAATHYLSMSLAEGWDLNCLNAMACGIPCIVPNHSGYTAYCKHSNVCLLPVAKKIQAEQQGSTGRLYQGANWFAPDEDEATLIATDYLRDQQESSSRASQAYDSAHSLYTWDKCAGMLESYLE